MRRDCVIWWLLLDFCISSLFVHCLKKSCGFLACWSVLFSLWLKCLLCPWSRFPALTFPPMLNSFFLLSLSFCTPSLFLVQNWGDDQRQVNSCMPATLVFVLCTFTLPISLCVSSTCGWFGFQMLFTLSVLHLPKKPGAFSVHTFTWCRFTQGSEWEMTKE